MTWDSYLEGDSFLHRLDPRARLMGLLPAAAAFFLPCPPPFTAAAAAAVVALVRTALGPRETLRPLRTLAPVLALVLLLTPLFSPGGREILRAGPVALVTVGGLAAAGLMAARFLGVSFVFYAVFRTLRLDDLVLSLRWMRLPYPACLAAVITLRMIPSIAGTWTSVLDAHRLRGGAARGAGLAWRWLPLLVSVLVETLKSIPALAMSLEARGFGRPGSRTSYLALAGKGKLARDIAFVSAACACLLVPGALLAAGG